MKNKNKYILSLSAKFTYFETARILYKRNQLAKIICGYPWFKLHNEKIPKELVSSNGIYNILKYPFLDKPIAKKYLDYLGILNKKNIDKKTLNFIEQNTDYDVLLGLAGVALNSAKRIYNSDKIFICERSSSEIGFQNKLLSEEYKICETKYYPTHNWYIENEQKEYDMADIILTPSNFVKNSFNEKFHHKIKVINFGVNTENFYKNNSINKSDEYFEILFIGQITIRKGLHYLIEAFKNFKHPKKRLHIVGSHTLDKDFFKKKLSEDNIVVHGHINHLELNNIINKSHIFVLPSIEEGFATVILQALSAGCPVVATENTGAKEFIIENNCGYVIPIRSSKAILEKLELLSENKNILKKLSNNALNKMRNQTWENYVNKLDIIVNESKKEKN